jgi:phosphatidylglycerol---prolipoprotein diacylglyceryl transferase
MHSELFHFGPITIRAFGLCLALGFITALWVATRLSAHTSHRTPDALSTLVIWMLLAGVAGARAAYVAEHWTAEFADPVGHGQLAALLRLDQGGLMFYGGLVGATAALAVFARIKRDSFLGLADLLVTVLPLGHAFGRVGCFLHGCCYGKPADTAISVCFPRFSPAWHDHVACGILPETAAISLPVIPTQLIEAAGNLILFALLAGRYRRWADRPGLAVGAYAIGYAALRFGVEALRGDPRMLVSVFSISQALSFALVAFGLALILRARHRPALQPASTRSR